MRGRLAAVCLVGALLAAPRLVLAVDLVVEGCNELQPHEVGVREAVGNIADTVRVAVTVNAIAPIAAFVLDVDVPPGVLSLVRAERGDLTAAWAVLSGHQFTATTPVRIGGFDPAHTIAAGSVGRLAVMVFVVTAAGTGAFGTSGLLDDLANYISCEDVHNTSHITESEWGGIKALYYP
ncbi:MAG: hypothetical protein U0167_08705 [bacterium]